LTAIDRDEAHGVQEVEIASQKKNPHTKTIQKKLLGNQIMTWCLIELSIRIMDMLLSQAHVMNSP
jgi:hypothetical protein